MATLGGKAANCWCAQIGPGGRPSTGSVGGTRPSSFVSREREARCGDFSGASAVPEAIDFQSVLRGARPRGFASRGKRRSSGDQLASFRNGGCADAEQGGKGPFR